MNDGNRVDTGNLGFLLAKASQHWNELLAEGFAERGFADVRPSYGSVLLPLFEDAGAFWLLMISAKHSRLYHGSRWEFVGDKTIDLPRGVGKIRAMTDYEETQYASPVGRRGTLAHAQSFGEAPEELRKSESHDRHSAIYG